MPNYKISVSKENKRYTIIFKAENEAIARERVHNEWYSILGVEEIELKEKIWHAFIFEWYKNWELKHWKIVWEDIFKVYVNLVKNLEYEIYALYSEKDKDISLKEKDKIIEELKEEYDLLFKNRKKDKIDELRDKIKKEREENINIDNFYMKKKLEDTNKLISHVLSKLESLIIWNSIVKLNLEQKQKLENIYNSIIKLKKSTNISKLREIWEVALQKIWKLELENLEVTKDEKSREFLNETNKLLAQFGSKDKFVEKEKTVWYQFEQISSYIKNLFSNIKKKKVKKEEIDKESHSYIRTKLYLNKYEEKLRDNTIYTLKNFFKLFFNKNLREINSLKRSVIKQNIFLLKARLKWQVISYSFISKWIFWVFWVIYYFFDFFRKNLFYIIFIYVISFIFFFSFWNLFWLNLDFNFDWIFLIILLFISYIFLSLSKKIYFLIINFALFIFIVILGVINF